MFFGQKLWMWLLVLVATVGSAIGGLVLLALLIVTGRHKAFNSQIDPPRK